MASQFFPGNFFDHTGQSLKASFGSGTDELLKGFFGALFSSAFAESELEGFFFCISGNLVLIGAFSIFFCAWRWSQIGFVRIAQSFIRKKYG
jgi:hypothetical protein